MIFDKALEEKYAKHKAILKMDGSMGFAPIRWDASPIVNEVVKRMIDRWTNARRKRAIIKFRSIIRKHKQNESK